VGQVATVFYFAFFIFLIPILGLVESLLAKASVKENLTDILNTQNKSRTSSF